MKYAIIDCLSVEGLEKVDGVESVEILSEHSVAGGNPTVRIGVKSYKVLHTLGYDEGEYFKD